MATVRMATNQPVGVCLASGEALGDLEAGPAGLSLVQSDVEVCFYQYRIPLYLRRFFGMPPIERRFLPPSLRRSLRRSVDGPAVTMRLKVAPMGWNWAVAFIQACHERLAAQGPGKPCWLRDKVPHAPVSTGLAAQVCYIDNLAALAAAPEEAEAVLSEMEAGLQDFWLDHGAARCGGGHTVARLRPG